MCGIVGFLDKRGGTERPIGRTLLAMLEALGCRGPDSTGVALFGLTSPHWIAQVKLPDDPEQSATILRSIASAAGAAPVLRHEAMGAYVRLELARHALPHVAIAEMFVLDRYPGTEVVSVGQRLEILKQIGSPAQLEQDYHIAHACRQPRHRPHTPLDRKPC